MTKIPNTTQAKKVKFFLGLALMMFCVLYSALRQQQLMGYQYVALLSLVLVAFVFDYMKVGQFLDLARTYERDSGSHEVAIRSALTKILKSPLVVRLIETELLTLYYAFFANFERSGIAGDDSRFAYAKSSNAHDMYLFVALSQLPFLPFIHAFVEYKKGPGVAWAITLLTLWSVVWYLAQIEAVKYRQIRLRNGSLIYRFGLFWKADIPLSKIKTARRIDIAETLDANELFLSPIGSKRNVVLEFDVPMVFTGPYWLRRREKKAAISLDEPDKFLASLSLKGVAVG